MNTKKTLIGIVKKMISTKRREECGRCPEFVKKIMKWISLNVLNEAANEKQREQWRHLFADRNLSWLRPIITNHFSRNFTTFCKHHRVFLAARHTEKAFWEFFREQGKAKRGKKSHRKECCSLTDGEHQQGLETTSRLTLRKDIESSKKF